MKITKSQIVVIVGVLLLLVTIGAFLNRRGSHIITVEWHEPENAQDASLVGIYEPPFKVINHGDMKEWYVTVEIESDPLSFPVTLCMIGSDGILSSQHVGGWGKNYGMGGFAREWKSFAVVPSLWVDCYRYLSGQ